MNLAGLRKDAERRLRRIERDLAFIALAGDTWRLDRRRHNRLQGLQVHKYLQPGEAIEVHRSVLPPDERHYSHLSPGRKFRWREWSVLPIDRIGPDCVRLLVPGVGSMPIPVGDFVRAVLLGHVREPQETPADGEKLPADAVG